LRSDNDFKKRTIDKTMIVGIGSDILEIARMKRELGADSNDLKDQLFTMSEINYCDSKHYPERHFAARFAAKEAIFKALATGKKADFSWQEIEISNDDNGQPHITLSGKVKEFARRLNATRIFVSLSHTEEWAMASVILESE
jgi:holo-[acyl-carrier protein] synthase